MQKFPFASIASDEWYFNAVLWAAQGGIVYGYDNGEFGLDDPVMREQAVSILHRYAKSKGLGADEPADLSGYADAGRISAWARDAMAWAVAAGIVQGRTPASIAPQGTSSRAELAMIFKRYVEAL